MILKYKQAILALFFLACFVAMEPLLVFAAPGNWWVPVLMFFVAFSGWQLVERLAAREEAKQPFKRSVTETVKGVIGDFWWILIWILYIVGFFAVDPLLRWIRPEGATWADYEFLGGGAWLVVPGVFLVVYGLQKLIERLAGFRR